MIFFRNFFAFVCLKRIVLTFFYKNRYFLCRFFAYSKTSTEISPDFIQLVISAAKTAFLLSIIGFQCFL